MRRLTRRQRISAAVLATLALMLIGLDVAGGGLRSAHTGVRGTLGALYRGTDALLGPTRRFLQGVPEAGSNQDRVAALRHQVAQLQGQLAAHAQDSGTSAELNRLHLSATTTGYQVVPARVLALGSGDGFDWTITLDVGTSSGVVAGQSVTDGVGLVGRVLHADRSSSVVLLGADPGSGVGVRDLRSGEIGVATGAGTSGFTFVPLNPQASLRVGDQLATGPTGATSYVADLSVGTVTSVRTSGDGSVHATVRATTSPTRLDLVGVLIGPGPGVQRDAIDPTGTGQ